MNKILITGGSGFIGTNLVEYLLTNHKNCTIYNIDINAPKISSHNQYWIKCDINELKQLKSEIDKISPDYIIHLAAEADVKFVKLSDFKTNIYGVENICKVANECSTLKRIVFTSTQYVHQFHGEPKNDNEYYPFTVYGESKVEGEKIVKQFGLNKTWTIIRPTNIYGPYNDVYVNGLFKVIDKGYYFHPNINAKRSYGYVENVVQQIINILFINEELISSKVFYVGDEPIWLIDFVNAIHKELGKGRIKIVPKWLFGFASIIGELANKINIPFPMNKIRYKNMITSNPIDMTPTFNLVGNSKITTEEGIRRTIRWYKNNRNY